MLGLDFLVYKFKSQSTNNNTALSGGSNVGDILGLLTGLTSTNTSNKKKPTSGVDLSDGLDLGDILGLVGSAASTNTSNKKKKNNGVDLSDGLDLGDILGLMNAVKK